MHIYSCELILMEPTFFSSREVSAIYQTEPLIGNYALAYAFGFCQSPYFNDGTIHYVEHLTELNARGLYVTPATISGEPRFTFGQFNAQADSYWYAFANNVIVTRPDGAWAEKRGAAWYLIRQAGERGQKVNLENRPQHGRIRFLALDNRALCHVISREPLTISHYIRLGKFMSKARVTVTEQPFEVVDKENMLIPLLLNPADLNRETTLHIFDLISVPPTPLVRNAVLDGRFYQLPGGVHLPTGMRFGVEVV